MIANVINDQQLTLVAMLILLTSTVLAFAFQVAVALPALATVNRLEASMGSELSEAFNDDLDLIGELARDYEPHHLRFARENFCMMASQLRSRVSLLVGAIEKVGAIPLALVSYLAFSKAFGTGIFGIAESVYAALIGLYILGLRANIVAQWMDRVALVYGAALDMRTTNNSLAK